MVARKCLKCYVIRTVHCGSCVCKLYGVGGKALRKTVGPKEKGITGERMELHSEELCDKIA